MGRKRKKSGAESAMDLVALLPWWAGLLLAVGSYFMFHALAAPVSPAAVRPGQMGGLVISAMVSALSSLLQYIAPLICVAAAFGSFFRRKARANLLSVVTDSKSAEALDKISWQEFELLVGEAFRVRGYQVMKPGQALTAALTLCFARTVRPGSFSANSGRRSRLT